MARTALAIRLAGDDIDRAHRAIEQMRAVGGDPAWLAEVIAARLDGMPGGRVSRRDEAIRSLASHCPPGSDRAKAKAIAAKLRRYDSGAWQRGRISTSPSLVISDETRALYVVMSNSGKGGAPGFETIRDALALAKIAVTHVIPQNANQSEDAA